MKYLFIVLLIQNIIVRGCLPQTFTWNTTDEQSLDWARQSLVNNENFYTPECLAQLLDRGYYRTALKIYEDYFLLNNIEIDEVIWKSLKDSKRNLDNFFNIHNKHIKQMQVWEPVFQWVQSNSSILFQVKFSHRLDAPACLNTKIESVQILENQVFLSAKGVLSNQPTNFVLNLTLFDQINISESKWNTESVGTLVFTLTKSTEGLWKRFTENQRKINIWWEMRSHFKKDMDQYIQMLEEESESKQKGLKNNNKKKQKEQLISDL